MGQDSSDYLQCQVCHGYEICLVVDCVGIETGLFVCVKGHVFCKECFPKFLSEIEPKTYGDAFFIRRQLKYYLDNRIRDLDYDSQNFIDEYEGWLKLSDKELVKVVSDNRAFDDDLFREVPKEFCPVCSSDLKFTDKDVMNFLLKKIGTTRNKILKEMRE